MNWLIYLVEANAYLVAFYLVYNLLLARETHYQLNRAYLILSSIAAFVLPLMQLNFLKPTVYVYVSNEAYVPVTSATPLWQIVLFYGYLAGVCIVLALFILKLMQLKRLTRSNVKVKRADHQLIRLKESNTAFSFFNYLFIGSNVADEKLVINHELVHIHQKHSADVIFIELLKAINWFNPVIYMLQNSIRTVHEYIADEQTAQSANNTMAYASFLVDNAYGQVGPAITHSFFNHNLLKKRIIMLDQKRSGKLARLKYLVVVPLCAALLGESTLGFSKSYGIIGIGEQKATIVNPITDTTKKVRVKVTDVYIGSNKKTNIKATNGKEIDTVRIAQPPVQ
ncbi:MAG TPA: M56 family metallopeptidase, partial [Mucilaginibacter sp.]